MSRFLHQHFDAIDSAKGIPTFYFRCTHHSSQHSQGIVSKYPTAVYETVIHVVFKDDEEAKNELLRYFKSLTEVNETTFEIAAFFPTLRNLQCLRNPMLKKLLLGGGLTMVY